VSSEVPTHLADQDQIISCDDLQPVSMKAPNKVPETRTNMGWNSSNRVI